MDASAGKVAEDATILPTPDTDAAEWNDEMCDPARVVESDFARKLERDRDAHKLALKIAHAQNRELMQQLATLREALGKIEKKADSLRSDDQVPTGEIVAMDYCIRVISAAFRKQDLARISKGGVSINENDQAQQHDSV